MYQDLISIIVPVYKVEAYLDECVQSIVNQTYTNLEIILVDDGSPDRCPEMCDAWAKRDARVRVIHQKNGGAASARNAGLDVARGDYIGFVDSDDYITPWMYETLLCSLKDSQKGMACSLTYFLFEDGSITSNVRREDSDLTLDVPQAVNETFFQKVGNAVWCKLYKRSVIEHSRFPVGEINEDYPIMIPHIVDADGMVLVRKPLYYYRQREGSVTARNSLIRIENTRVVYKNLMLIQHQIASYEIPCERGYRFFAARVAYSMALIMEKDFEKIGEDLRVELKKYRRLMQKNFWQYIFSRYSSQKDKILYTMVVTATLRPMYKLFRKKL